MVVVIALRILTLFTHWSFCPTMQTGGKGSLEHCHRYELLVQDFGEALAGL